MSAELLPAPDTNCINDSEWVRKGGGQRFFNEQLVEFETYSEDEEAGRVTVTILPAMQAPSILLPVRKGGGQRFSVSSWLGLKPTQRLRRQVEYR